MKMKIYRTAILLMIPAFLAGCKDENTAFGLDCGDIEIDAAGGTRTVKVTSTESWVAKTQEPWITVSPANGTGSAECRIIIDSALTVTPREGMVRIETINSGERKDFTIKQEGFRYEISPDNDEVEVASYAALADRHFEIKVKTNVPFDVVIPEQDASWLTCKKDELNLDRGARPRSVTLNFTWNFNVNQESRSTNIRLVPQESGITPSGKESITVRQLGAEPIEIGVKGDSLALIAINRALGCWREFETAEKMEYWTGVTVWKSGENKGRVRSASFFLFDTKEGLPFQVKYLTAAEELYFFSNSNTFLKDLYPGGYICELTQLKRLTISAYGLIDLPEEFKNLKNLEYLDLSGNNFQKIPQVIDEDNFPNLRTLIMNANTRSTIYDLSNTVKEDLGGLIDECAKDESGKRSFPERLLKWSALDTLRLSVNYLQGSIPDFEDDPSVPKWTAAEVNACDTLPARLIGVPKILPNAKLFSVNLNRLSGKLPDWLLFHPKLDLWIPFSLVFPQDGKDLDGNLCGFTNEPANLDYYYKEYVNKKYNPNNIAEEE
ncbi:MAG: BACON domain-containing protein [Candidatus Cryptobacteroides sp.]